MGYLITVAEPDLLVLSGQVSEMITPSAFVTSVGIGVGVFLLIALLKILFQKN